MKNTHLLFQLQNIFPESNVCSENLQLVPIAKANIYLINKTSI